MVSPPAGENVVLPRPEYQHPGAKIGYTYETSEPDFPPLPEARVALRSPTRVVLLTRRNHHSVPDNLLSEAGQFDNWPDQPRLPRLLRRRERLELGLRLD